MLSFRILIATFLLLLLSYANFVLQVAPVPSVRSILNQEEFPFDYVNKSAKYINLDISDVYIKKDIN